MLIKIYSKMIHAVMQYQWQEVVARGEVFDGGHKIKSVKIVSTSKGNQKVTPNM
jgi:hypothetical protein